MLEFNVYFLLIFCITSKPIIMSPDDLTLPGKLLNLLREFDWINRFVKSTIERFFWKRILRDLAQLNHEYQIYTDDSLLMRANRDPFKGMIQSIFHRDRAPITNLDLAVALYITLNGHCQPNFNRTALIDLSAKLMKIIIQRLEKNLVYRYEIRNARKTGKFSYQTDRLTVSNILSSNTSLFTHYFGSFNEQSFHSYVTVWYPGQGQSWIDWKPANSIRVHLDPENAPKGFYLIGFDYSNHEGHFLKKATRKNSLEYFNKHIEGEVIWRQ